MVTGGLTVTIHSSCPDSVAPLRRCGFRRPGARPLATCAPRDASGARSAAGWDLCAPARACPRWRACVASRTSSAAPGGSTLERSGTDAPVSPGSPPGWMASVPARGLPPPGTVPARRLAARADPPSERHRRGPRLSAPYGRVDPDVLGDVCRDAVSARTRLALAKSAALHRATCRRNLQDAPEMERFAGATIISKTSGLGWDGVGWCVFVAAEAAKPPASRAASKAPANHPEG